MEWIASHFYFTIKNSRFPYRNRTFLEGGAWEWRDRREFWTMQKGGFWRVKWGVLEDMLGWHGPATTCHGRFRDFLICTQKRCVYEGIYECFRGLPRTCHGPATGFRTMPKWGVLGGKMGCFGVVWESKSVPGFKLTLLLPVSPRKTL